MSQTFLDRFMQAAKRVTNAERGVAVDANLQVVALNNIDGSIPQTPEFQQFGFDNLRNAMQTGEPIIANNIITDLSDAPTTNTNFANLRIVVAIPVVGVGAVYLDQHIRNGIIAKQVIERLTRLGAKLVADNQLDIEVEAMIALYEQIS